MTAMAERQTLLAMLEWYLASGVDEAILERAVDRSASAADSGTVNAAPAPAKAPEPSPAPSPDPSDAAPPLPSQPAETRRARLERVGSLADLRARVEAIDDFPLKKTATRTVFGVGPDRARVMLIGEAPGAEEDRRGEPFVGPSGQLLDRMLAAIGLARDEVYITNTLYWRPPGNRTPTPAEVNVVMPLLRRQIALVSPEVLVLLGAPAAKRLLERSEGIMRLRGRWFDYAPAEDRPAIPAMPTFHPAFLLRQPAQKRETWRDLRLIRERLGR